MKRCVLIVVVGLLLGSCGTYVPNLREFPETDPQLEKQMLVQIVRSIECELSYVVTTIVAKDLNDAKLRMSGKIYTDFLASWGAEVAVNLTLVERIAVNPTIAVTPPVDPTTFLSLNGGLSASSEATRLEKLNLFYTVKELYRPGMERCYPGNGNKFGSPLVDSDLKLYALLEGRIGAATLGFANTPDKEIKTVGSKNVLSHTVSFKVVTSGSISPNLRLVRANFNPAGTLLGAGRDRTHELVITFGPLDGKKGARSLVPIAENAHQNSQLQTGIRTLSSPF